METGGRISGGVGFLVAADTAEICMPQLWDVPRKLQPFLIVAEWFDMLVVGVYCRPGGSLVDWRQKNNLLLEHVSQVRASAADRGLRFIVVGDFNARVGNAVLSGNVDHVVNPQGRFLMEWIRVRGLIPLVGVFSDLGYTFDDGRNGRSTVDYMFGSRQLVNDVTVVRSPDLEQVISDHRPVIIRLPIDAFGASHRPSLNAVVGASPWFEQRVSLRYRFPDMTGGSESGRRKVEGYRQSWVSEISLEDLEGMEEDTVGNLMESLSAGLLRLSGDWFVVCRQGRGRRARVRHCPPPLAKDIQRITTQRRRYRRASAEWISLSRQLRKLVRNARVQATRLRSDRLLRTAQSSPSRHWKLLRRWGGSDLSGCLPLTFRDANGNRCTTVEEVNTCLIQRFMTPLAMPNDMRQPLAQQQRTAAFTSLLVELGRPPHGRHCVDLSHFTIDDVKQCLATLPRETACGVDGVKYEMLRLGGARLNEVLVRFVNKMIDTKCQGLPDWFFEAILTPVPKIKASGAGDEALDPKNYRPIMLQSVLYKLFALLMLPRMERWAAKLLVPDGSQCGFRRGQGAVHAVTAAMIKLKDRERRGLSTSAVFLDIASAYDTVDRSLLIHLFQWLRAGDDFCDLLRHLLQPSIVWIRTAYGYVNAGVSDRGVKQGDPLSPLLFNIYLSVVQRFVMMKYRIWLLSKLEGHEDEGRVRECLRASDSDHVDVVWDRASLGHYWFLPVWYADDGVLFAGSLEVLSAAVSWADEAATMLQMKFNPRKSVLMRFLGRDRTSASLQQGSVRLQGVDIATATETRWLGFTVTEDLRLRRHCELRLKAAKVAHRQFMDMGVWQMGVSYGQAVILWKTLVLPRLLYGVEVLAVLGEAWPEADVFVKHCVSEVLQLPRRSPTTALVGELGVRPLKIELLRRKLRWYAQSMRNPVEELQPGVDINIAAWCCTGVLGKKADVDTGDSFPRQVLLELQGLECAGGRLPAWIHSLKRDVVTAFALAWSGDYCAFQHEKEFLGSIEDVINARTLEYISSGAASYAEVHGMSDRIVKPCFRVYRVLRKPHGKILWSCRTQTLGLLGEVNRAGGGSSAARERCRLCGMGVETLHHLLFECRCEGLSDTRLRFLHSVVQDVFHAPCSWWLRGEGGGEARQRLLLTPEREDAILRAARGLYTAPVFGIRSSGCGEVMVSTRVWNLFFTRFRALLEARLQHHVALSGGGEMGMVEGRWWW